ncbi:hypothetical protein [Fervidibacillus albus]|uniref:Zinc-finger domain-containing protein n=1 Tax=Fervidibacillus albus TaxID=2980026 RepID=A0A9E8LSM4_9BACI|nr:hypothetical protein [Fervidibacillus albus]WAA08843.1 hypothetical protein OE104_09500 [Fervidibacillus albus]
MKTSHYSVDQWVAFSKGELRKEVYMEMEDHLYHCDHCLAIYSKLMIEDETVPPMSDDLAFTDQVMEKLSQMGRERKNSTGSEIQRKTYMKQTIIHYTIAAGLTILLMFSGAFEKLSAGVGEVHDTGFKQKESVTENLLNKTLSLLDSMKVHAKEAKTE